MYTGQTAEKLVSNVLAQTFLAKQTAGKTQDFRCAQTASAIGAKAGETKLDGFLLMDLAQIMVQSFDLEPVGIGSDHAPGHQIVECRTP